MSTSQSLLDDPRPWAFSRAELAAGLRRYSADYSLAITDIQEFDIPHIRPSIGRIRGLRVVCSGAEGEKTYKLVLKEPQGTTRRGTVGAGRREVSFYRYLAEQLPIQLPELLAAHPDGEWLAFKLLPEGSHPEPWLAGDYKLAIRSLVILHDRFWNLGEDLMSYNWLARPIGSDYEIHVSAAKQGVKCLLEAPANSITQDIELLKDLKRLVQHAGVVVKVLREAPSTLLHGDYWPGNLAVYPDRKVYIYDWQQAAIGPGILDLLFFIQSSLWWYESLPVSVSELVDLYRAGIAKLCGQVWTEAEWSRYWDSALIWTFMAGWIDILANTPASILQTRHYQLDALWLDPVRRAISRNLPK